MKKNVYYYSEKKLQYIEIKKFYSKFISLIALFSFLCASIIFGGYILVSNIVNPVSKTEEIKAENLILKEKFKDIALEVNSLNKVIDELNNKDSDLRLSVNLQPESEADKNIGIGGSVFNEILPNNVSDIKSLLNSLDNSLSALKSKTKLVENNYKEIETSLNSNVELFKSIPALLPTVGPVGDRFGNRVHPILRIRRMHTGIDIVVDTGTEINSPGDAKVIEVGTRGGYGLVVELDHGFGYTSIYAHLSKAKVKKGQRITRGDLIGLSGSSGRLATGPHLHYEVLHNGIHLNPQNFIFEDIKLFDLVLDKSSK